VLTCVNLLILFLEMRNDPLSRSFSDSPDLAGREPSVRLHCIFLLSPPNIGGNRARMFLKKEASSELARRLHVGGRISLGEAFSFMSGLYFREKLT
jgi:hypothetical protein